MTGASFSCASINRSGHNRARMKAKTPKKKHGGARPGAGRPAKIDAPMRVHVTLPSALVKWLDAQAKKAAGAKDKSGEAAAYTRSDLVRDLLEKARKKAG